MLFRGWKFVTFVVFIAIYECFCSSVVPKSGLIPFNPQREPFKSYSTRLKHFLTDAGVRRAIDFHNSGKIPKMFKWLILGETGYLDPTIESEGEEVQVETGDEVVDAGEEVQKAPAAKKQKVAKEASTTTALVVKNKRGRKPKNLTNPEINSEAIASPKPMNPSDMMKIEALISSRMSTESIGNKAVPSEI